MADINQKSECYQKDFNVSQRLGISLEEIKIFLEKV